MILRLLAALSASRGARERGSLAARTLSAWIATAGFIAAGAPLAASAAAVPALPGEKRPESADPWLTPEPGFLAPVEESASETMPLPAQAPWTTQAAEGQSPSPPAADKTTSGAMELSPWPPPSEALATGEALTAPATPAMPIPALPAETVPTTEASGEALEAIPAEFAEDLMPPRPAHASYGPLRIGYLPRPAEGGLDEPLARRLAEALRQDQALRHALVAEGFSDSEDGDAAIVIQGADGFRDLANRLEHREFDVAFCPATVFVSLRNVRNEYRAILQERRPMDTSDPRGGGQILRQGVIFAGPASPFFQGEEPTTDTLKRLFRSEELVVPSAYDASGYFYPRLTLAGEFGVSPDRFRFAGSSRDTVKHVVSGLGAVGACDLGTIEHWLALEAAPDVPLDKMIRVLAYCPPHPTDPVIIRDELHPSISRAGRAINDALKAFFSRGARFALEPSKDDFFAGLAADYGRLDSLRRPGGPR